MKSPLVSLIVTVYNLEKYLPACLDSILAQSFEDYEIVLVNNNSCDNSDDVCRDFASRDCRIRYYLLEGKSVMWNAHRHGLEQARGEYVWFIDGDDLLPNSALEIVAAELQSQTPEVVFGRFNTFVDGGGVNFVDSPYESEHINNCTKDEALQYLIKKQQPVLATWRLIYSRKLYNDVIRHEKFTQLMRNAHQDTAFNAFILISADSIRYIDQPIYDYRVRQASISRTDNSEKILAYSKAVSVFMRLFDLVKTDSEREFVEVYYKQFVFLLSAIVCSLNVQWDISIVEEITAFTKEIGAKNTFSLESHAGKCREYLAKIAESVKNRSVYLAPTGNVGIFLKNALEQHEIKISGFFDNDKAKEGIVIDGAVVQAPKLVQSAIVIIGASYAGVPRQLKEQFLSLGVCEKDIITIEF
ncbi:MAG: glycosyltransferase family 2 protein [Oscillospiraceae bacterium]|nr:glycosyltransferase family 2 protein [Oscillospiraceae bacterium]